MAVNVADTLQRWTNDIIPAGLHQVTIPGNRLDESEGVLPERYSVAFFQKSNREESVGSMPEFVSEKTPAKYEHMSAIEYHNRRHAILYA